MSTPRLGRGLKSVYIAFGEARVSMEVHVSFFSCRFRKKHANSEKAVSHQQDRDEHNVQTHVRAIIAYVSSADRTLASPVKSQRDTACFQFSSNTPAFYLIEEYFRS